MRKTLAAFLLASALTGCGPRHASFVKVDNVALGRVVVYRNGVAFYERRATVSGGVLEVSVPRERVDDFLKSLTVVDAISGKPLPVSIPRQQTEDGPYLAMRLQLPNTDKADVVLTYVTEAPAWKPSYRVVVRDDGTVMLEGWAIVDNTSGEDWKGVIVGVGSSSALSFKYDLWSVRSVQRETLASEERFAIAPPTGVSPYAAKPEPGADTGEAVAELGVDEIRAVGSKEAKDKKPDQPKGEEVAVLESNQAYRGSGAGATSPAPVMPSPPPRPMAEKSRGYDDDDGEDDAPRQSKSRPHVAKKAPPREAVAAGPVADPRVASGDAKMRQLSEQVNRGGKHVRIEAYGDANQSGAQQHAYDRANLVKYQLIDHGVAPAKIDIVTHVEPGNAERVRLVAQAETAPALQGDVAGQGKAGRAAAEQDAQPVGESNFASPTAMTVERGSSAMVSMVRAPTAGEVVYLYDSESERGNDRFAFRAVRFKNPTDSTLETGPVTVYGNERFIGEGLTEPIAPRSIALVPYALDRQIVVDRDSSDEDKIAKLVTLQRGILTAEVQHIRREKLVITNRLPTPAKIFIRHTLGKGWTLLDAPPRDERIGDAHLFEVDVAPGTQQSVVIAEATPLQRTLDMNADATLGMMKAFLEAPALTPELKAQLDKMLGIHKKLVDFTEEQASVRRRLADYRERMDELHAQIVTLQAVKTGGELMVHLKDKMKDISERVQKATIAGVDLEEKIMLTRVQFQDAIAELALPDATRVAAGAPR